MQINGRNFTIGADPELFLKGSEGFVSAHTVLPGNKQEPFKVEKGAVQVDGMAAEFNIDPAEDFEQFKSNLDTVQNALKGMIGDLDFLDAVSVNFDEEFASQIPAENMRLGCEADYNAWHMCENAAPEEANLLRTAGGHIHIGGFETDNPFGDDHFGACAKLARILDSTIGVYSILWDKDDNRRSMYGKAGCFRPKSYGMEYRTLSNKWLFDDKHVKFVFDGVKEALIKVFDKSFKVDPSVQQIINESNRGSDYFVGDPKAEYLGV